MLALWAVLICCVVVGSLLPAKSSLITAIGRAHVSLKVLHYCAYTLLALLALIAVPRRSSGVLAAFAMVLLGVAVEFAQKLAPGRSCEIRDMLINGAGVITGVAIGLLGRGIASAVGRS
jgi:VanZ family protein